MKKIYSKPEIMFESFAMSTSIAAGCDNKVTTPSLDQCGVEFGGDILFWSTMSACTTPLDKNTDNDPVCYHNPTDDTNMFNS